VSLPRLDGIRVLVLFGNNRIFGSEIGNLEVFRQMARLGLRARFITSRRWGHHEIQPALDRLGFEWTTAPFGYRWSKYMLGRHFGYFLLNLYGVVATSWRLWREVRTWKPTHIYCMNWMFFTNAMPAILWSRLPLIYRAGDELPTHTRFHRWIVEKLSRRVNRVVCVSNFIRQGMLHTGFAEKKLTVLYSYPAGRPRKVSSPKLPAKPPGARVLIYVGRVSEAKGTVVLLDAVERLVRQEKDLVLWVVGSSDEEDKTCDELRKRVELTGNQQRIFFLGHVDDVSSIYSQADIHICPSVTTEALPHVVLEAKQCGKPSVVLPTGGIPELIEHEVDGYVCRAKTAEALAEGIRFFLNDPEKRRLAGEAARRSLEEKFGEERFRRAWAEVFAEGKAEN
jgi:glycosyltransferase involved in cell wall biosynthesis